MLDAFEGIVKKYSKYKADAYIIVLDGLERYLASQPARRHVKAEELFAGIIRASLDYWGPLSLEVLKTFGIKEINDIGRVVEILINEQYLTKGPDDKIEDFYTSDGTLEELIQTAWENELMENPPQMSGA